MDKQKEVPCLAARDFSMKENYAMMPFGMGRQFGYA